MNVICIEEKAFYALWDRMFKYVQSQMEMNTSDKWIDKKEAKRLLRIDIQQVALYPIQQFDL